MLLPVPPTELVPGPPIDFDGLILSERVRSPVAKARVACGILLASRSALVFWWRFPEIFRMLNVGLLYNRRF